MRKSYRKCPRELHLNFPDGEVPTRAAIQNTSKLLRNRIDVKKETDFSTIFRPLLRPFQNIRFSKSIIYLFLVFPIGLTLSYWI
jgi:hypothetical protein